MIFLSFFNSFFVQGIDMIFISSFKKDQFEIFVDNLNISLLSLQEQLNNKRYMSFN